jgi:hypothetical protein
MTRSLANFQAATSSLIAISFADEFDDCQLATVAQANASQLHDSSVATGTLTELWTELVEQQIHGGT